jgi:hypothetical protein
MHRYIQIKMECLEITSLDAAYRYDVQIEKKFKQKRKEFVFAKSS